MLALEDHQQPHHPQPHKQARPDKGRGKGKGKDKGKGKPTDKGKGKNGCKLKNAKGNHICYAFNNVNEGCTRAGCKYKRECGVCFKEGVPLFRCNRQ